LEGREGEVEEMGWDRRDKVRVTREGRRERKTRKEDMKS
jgi:hypothetical protein